MYIPEISEDYIIRAIKKFKGNITMRLDLIPPFSVKDCGIIFAKPLKIILLPYLNLVYFQSWKFSRICSVYKKHSIRLFIGLLQL